MAENKEAKKDKTGWDTILQIIQTLVPALGVFAALCYFLGRLYLDSYYYALGVSPKVLTFTTNDYMFSSFNSVIMCLVFSVLFYIYWKWFITAEEMEKKPFAEIAKHKVEVFLVLMGIFLVSALYYIVFLAWPKTYVTGVSGLTTGLGLGILIIAINVIINTRSEKKEKGKKPEQAGKTTEPGQTETVTKPEQSEKSTKSGQPGKGSFILQLLIYVIIMLSLMPLITDNLAMAQARSDLKKFPIVEVITEEDFPVQLQDGSTSYTDSVAGRLIITSEKTIYLSKLDVCLGDITENLATIPLIKTIPKINVLPSSATSNVTWKQVYAIPTDSIKDIIYYSIKK